MVDPPLDSDALAHALTMAGLEVEHRAPVAPAFTHVVVAKVLTVERHPNAERLTVCTVDAGRDAPLTIVCGAPNVAPGVVAPCALAGAELPGGMVIRNATMRGVESQGMLCSAAELGLSDDASGLLLLDPGLTIGTDLRQALDLDDSLLTLKLTPNRADCLSRRWHCARSRRNHRVAGGAAVTRADNQHHDDDARCPRRGTAGLSTLLCPRHRRHRRSRADAGVDEAASRAQRHPPNLRGR